MMLGFAKELVEQARHSVAPRSRSGLGRKTATGACPAAAPAATRCSTRMYSADTVAEVQDLGEVGTLLVLARVWPASPGRLLWSRAVVNRPGFCGDFRP